MIFELGNFGFLKKDNARSLFDKKIEIWWDFKYYVNYS